MLCDSWVDYDNCIWNSFLSSRKASGIGRFVMNRPSPSLTRIIFCYGATRGVRTCFKVYEPLKALLPPAKSSNTVFDDASVLFWHLKKFPCTTEGHPFSHEAEVDQINRVSLVHHKVYWAGTVGQECMLVRRKWQCFIKETKENLYD